jgi:Transglycosylase SLT domain
VINTATAPTVAPRRLGPAVLAGLAVLAGVLLVMLMAIIGAIFGLRPLFSGGYGPSGAARTDIPAAYLRLYVQAGQRYGIDPWVLAAIGSIESSHGRSRAPGVHSGVNAYGCCAGPMQFSVVGSPSTWESYGVDGDRDGHRSPYDPADAIPAAAKYLRANGAPSDYRPALFAYNHADWYVAQVLATADRYRGAPTILPPFQPPRPANVRAVLDNRRITLTPLQRSDLRSSAIDPRVISVLAWIGRRHNVTVTALKSDHSYLTASGNVSNHSAGRAVDIAIVDREPCRGTRTGKCAQLVRELAAIDGPLRATELIYCWDPDGPRDPRGFARADHCNHIHWGIDG